MAAPNSWYSEEALWKLIEPVLFSPQRQARAREEVDKIEHLLQIKQGASILDLCCGVGRHSLELARRGYDVTGVDRTRAYIEKAREIAIQPLGAHVLVKPIEQAERTCAGGRRPGVD